MSGETVIRRRRTATGRDFDVTNDAARRSTTWRRGFRPRRHRVHATVGFVNASAREACIAKIREVETLRYDPRAIDTCMAIVRQHALHSPHGDTLCATIEKLLRAGNASRAERLLDEAPVGSRGLLVWVAVVSIATVAFVGVLHRAIKSKADEAVASAPQWVVGAESVTGPEAALTDATVRLVGDLAAGRSEAAYGRMSETYRALVSLDRFEAAIAANPLLFGAHDAPTRSCVALTTRCRHTGCSSAERPKCAAPCSTAPERRPRSRRASRRRLRAGERRPFRSAMFQRYRRDRVDRRQHSSSLRSPRRRAGVRRRSRTTAQRMLPRTSTSS